MGLRPGRCVRSVSKPAWTRYSKKKPRKSYIKAMPHRDLNVFRMGTEKKDYDLTLHLVAQEAAQIRDNAIESARQSANKLLEKKIAGNYYFVVRTYPHQIIRENKMIAGAGADRLQKGMRAAFGRPTDRAVRLRKNQQLFTISTYKANEDIVKQALTRAKLKLSGSYRILAA